MLDKYLPISIFETLFSPIGWLIIKPISTPISFFETDAAAAEILDSRFNLGKILWKLNGYAQAEPLKIPPCTSHLFITNPEPLIMKNAFLKIHPSIESRLQRLLGYFPP
jgi:heat shock protein HtpX